MNAVSPIPSLRERLLDLAEEELDKDGHERLSLRALAAAANVAPSAPYRHFASRDALLGALVERGFEALLDSHRRAGAARADPLDRLRLAVAGFVGFARRRPHLFRLMFTARITSTRKPDGPAARSFATFEQLVAATPRARADGGATLHALSIWATMHGAVMLELDGTFRRAPSEGLNLEAIVEDHILHLTR